MGFFLNQLNIMSNIRVNSLPSPNNPLLIAFGFYHNLGRWEICKSMKSALFKCENETVCYVEMFSSIDELLQSTDQYFWKFKSFRNQVQSYIQEVYSAQEQEHFYNEFPHHTNKSLGENFNELKKAS